MSSRIKLKIKNLDQAKLILDDLSKSIQGEISMELEIQENKETMSYLCASSYIQDWDYVTAENNEAAEKLPEEKIVPVKEDEEKEDLGFFKNFGIEEGDWNMVAWIIEATWRAAKTRSAVKFQSSFFYEVVKEGLLRTAGPEHTLLCMTGEGYYTNYEWEEIEEDLTWKLGKLWISGMKDMTLTEVATKLYKS